MRWAASFSTACVLITGGALAGPWVEPGDSALRDDLATLADAGVIRSPMTTWPLAWPDIIVDVRRGDVAELNDTARMALERVRARGQIEMRLGAPVAKGRLGVAEEPPIIRTFEDTPREDAQVTGEVSYMGERFAMRLSAAYVSAASNDTEFRADGSYITATLGNWLITAGYPERWWGPGWDGSLILSTNARPTPQIALNRNSAQHFNSRWLRWIGPWSLTSFMGRLDDERFVNDALLFGLRVAFKPLPGLEIGLSRTAQWCGDSRPCDAEAFFNLLVGRDNRGVNVADEDEPGNQLAGIDLRWVPRLPNRPAAFYVQWIGEDSRQGGPQIGSWLRQVGVELSGPAFSGRWRHRTYLEFSDTICREGGLGFSDKKFNCGYTHSIYRSGYRYEGRSIGHGMDGDGTGYAIRSMLMRGQDRTWHLSLRQFDVSQGSAPNANHSISLTPQVIKDISVMHTHSFRFGTLRAGLGYQDIRDALDPGLDDGSFFGWIDFIID